MVNDWCLGVVVFEKTQSSCGKYVAEPVGARLASRESSSRSEVSRHEYPWWPFAPQPGALQVGGRREVGDHLKRERREQLVRLGAHVPER